MTFKKTQSKKGDKNKMTDDERSLCLVCGDNFEIKYFGEDKSICLECLKIKNFLDKVQNIMSRYNKEEFKGVVGYRNFDLIHQILNLKISFSQN